MADTNPTPQRQTAAAADACADCAIGRRTFLTLAGGLTAALGLDAHQALALTVRAGRSLAASAGTVTYAVPAQDGALVDATHAVILVRWQQHLYAFSSRCPHKQASVQWYPSVHEFVCPKHKARYNPLGAHVAGRATRNLDRHPLQRVGANVVVNTAVLYESDISAAQWSAATIQV